MRTANTAHSGARTRVYPLSSGGTITAHHVGATNMSLHLASLAAQFPNPEKVVFQGNSAGGLGVDCNLFKVAATWPEAAKFELNVAGFPLDSRVVPGAAGAAESWGAWHFHQGIVVADTCPLEPAGGSTSLYQVHDVMRWNRIHLGAVRIDDSQNNRFRMNQDQLAFLARFHRDFIRGV